MNIPCVPPPCDEDYARLEAELDGAPSISTDSVEYSDDSEDPADDPSEIAHVGGRSYSELREIQRILLSDIRSTKTKPQERSQCARAYRDIEIVRRAIRGKPLALNAIAKIDTKRSAPSPMLAIAAPDQSQAA